MVCSTVHPVICPISNHSVFTVGVKEIGSAFGIRLCRGMKISWHFSKYYSYCLHGASVL